MTPVINETSRFYFWLIEARLEAERWLLRDREGAQTPFPLRGN